MDFQISIEETSEVERNIKIEVPREIYKREYDRILSTTASRAQVKGFRPGRVPREMVVKLYGKQIHDDVVRDLAVKGYENAVKEHNLQVVGWPDFDIKDEQPTEALTITAGIAVYPRPKIKDYFGLTIAAPNKAVTDEDVTKAKERLRESMGSFDPIIDRTVAQGGDIVQVDYHGTVDGQEQDALHEHGAYVEIGAKQGVPGFEDAIVGMNVGEDKTTTLTLPEDLKNEELAGKEASYRISLRGIFKKDLPELTEEFIKERNLADSADDLDKKIRQSLEREIEKQNRQAKENALFTALTEGNSFAVPKKMVLEEIRQMLFEYKALDPKNRNSYSIDVSQFYDALGTMAEDRVRRGVILSRIIEQESFSASDEDLEEWVTKAATDAKREVPEIKETIGFTKNKSRFRDALTREKMVDKLLDSATITDAPSEDEKSSAGKKAKKKAKAEAADETASEAKPKKKTSKKKEG